MEEFPLADEKGGDVGKLSLSGDFCPVRGKRTFPMATPRAGGCTLSSMGTYVSKHVSGHPHILYLHAVHNSFAIRNIKLENINNIQNEEKPALAAQLWIM